MPGAQALLQALRACQLKLAVVTNTPQPLARQILAHTGILALIDTSSAAGEAAEKPSPELVLLALERLALPAAHVIYVGDSSSDRAATQAAQVYIVGFRRAGDAEISQLSQLTDLL